MKLFHNVVDIRDRANRKTCVDLLRYIVETPETSVPQLRIFAKGREDEDFQQIVFVNHFFEEFFYQLDVMISVYDKVDT